MKLDQITPITDFKRDAASLIQQIRKQRSPLVITQNGRATAVLQDVQTFEEDRRAFALLKLALQGDDDVARGRRFTLAEHKKRMAAFLRERGIR